MNPSERGQRTSRTEDRGADPVVQTFGFLGGAAAWAAYLAIAYVLVEIDCKSDRLAFEFLGLPGTHFFGFTLTLLAASTAIVAALLAAASHPRWLRRTEPDPAVVRETDGRSRFLAFAGTVMSGLFAIAILANGSTFFFLAACT